MAKIYDISQTISSGIPVWPGDTNFTYEQTWIRDGDCPVNVSKIIMSSHTGTHADAPLHYGNGAADIATVSLRPYLGECHVVDARPHSVVTADMIELPEKVPRVLVKMFDSYPSREWPKNFPTLSPCFIDAIAARGALLVGVESPSIDPETSKDLPAHKAVEKHGLAILEGLVLTEVSVGKYQLIAPPLKLAGVDASPVRAILYEADHA